jgi:hypothetical protein
VRKEYQYYIHEHLDRLPRYPLEVPGDHSEHSLQVTCWPVSTGFTAIYMSIRGEPLGYRMSFWDDDSVWVVNGTFGTAPETCQDRRLEMELKQGIPTTLEALYGAARGEWRDFLERITEK